MTKKNERLIDDPVGSIDNPVSRSSKNDHQSQRLHFERAINFLP